jgi:SAM-dependent methyltransferase
LQILQIMRQTGIIIYMGALSLGRRESFAEVIQIPDPVDNQTARQFSVLPLNLQVRSIVRQQYGGRDITQDLIDAAQMDAKDSVVDLGCGDGALLVALATKGGVEGPKVGVELLDTSVAFAKARAAKDVPGLTNLDFITGDIQERLSLRSDSANNTVLENVIYHVSRPEKVAEKAFNLTQPGGQLIIVTKDVGDLGKAWKWVGEEAPAYFSEHYSETYPNMKLSAPFYANCDLERTVQIFDALFDRQYPEEINSPSYMKESITHLKIQGKDAWTDYMYVLHGICEELDPLPTSSERRLFIREVLKPKFDAELAEKGYVEDFAKQFILIYKKPEERVFNILNSLRLINNHPMHSRPELLQAAAAKKLSKLAHRIGALTAGISQKTPRAVSWRRGVDDK